MMSEIQPKGYMWFNIKPQSFDLSFGYAYVCMIIIS